MHKSLFTQAIHRLDQYAEITNDETTTEQVTIPGNLEELSTAELQELHQKALDAWKASYSEEADLTAEQYDALTALGTGIQGVKQELAAREQVAAERKENAKKLADDLGITNDTQNDDQATADEGDKAEEEAPAEDAPAEDETPADDSNAYARRPVTFNAPVKAKAPVAQKLPAAPVVKASPMFATVNGRGIASGDPITFDNAAELVAHRLDSFNVGAYKSAERNGVRMTGKDGVFAIQRNFPEELTVQDQNSASFENALVAASNPNNVGGTGNSLLAAGGWCAPSETLYDQLLELESSEGILSIPEIQMNRGGVSRSLGPNFAYLFNELAGFHYTETQDAAGDYDGQGGGSKPCVTVPCDDFQEFRLELDGLCVKAGLLQQRSYPEIIARVIRGALIAHRHRIAGRTIQAMVAGSTAVVMQDIDGATANILGSIELQVEHMRASHRMAHSTILEAVFPYWVMGAIRSDLAKRNGVDLLGVTDDQIKDWFRIRGVNAQFVYNWQDPNQKTAAEWNGWGTTVDFLLYPAGSWVRGVSDIISLETQYDSNTLGTNDYTALFVEEGSVVIPMGHDSRVVTVPLRVSGATGKATATLERTGVELEDSTTTFAGQVPAAEPAPSEPAGTDPVATG